jgi:hypothetical protein
VPICRENGEVGVGPQPPERPFDTGLTDLAVIRRQWSAFEAYLDSMCDGEGS